MHQVIRTLSKVANRYLPSRMLTFDAVHVFKTFQLMKKYGRVSRAILIQELGLGEGSIKTLVKHMKMSNLVETSKGGMWMSEKGLRFSSKLEDVLSCEMNIPKCSFSIGKYNHAVLIKKQSSEIGSGIEQRDVAIKMGALGATTLLFEEGTFYIPGKNKDPLKGDLAIRKKMIKMLRPQNGDVIIIGSADNKLVAEFAAKNAALVTISTHHRHV